MGKEISSYPLKMIFQQLLGQKHPIKEEDDLLNKERPPEKMRRKMEMHPSDSIRFDKVNVTTVTDVNFV